MFGFGEKRLHQFLPKTWGLYTAETHKKTYLLLFLETLLFAVKKLLSGLKSFIVITT